jgi:hypothetical protein
MSKHHSCESNQEGSGCGCGKSNCSCKSGKSCQSSGGGSCGCCCGGGKCQCSCHQSADKGHEECGFAHELLDLADQAWMEVLKERIKEEIKKNRGDHIEELAKVVTETNRDRWKNKMTKKQNCEQFGEKLKQIFRNK